MSLQDKASLTDRAVFISEYAGVLMGSGVHTSRVVRNTKRLSTALDIEVTLSMFPRTIILEIADKESKKYINKVIEIPTLPISFEYNADLSKLSWEAVDNTLSLQEIKERFSTIVEKPRLNRWLLLLLVGAANASFCRLFGGDWTSMFVVFVATIIGFFIRVKLFARGINHYIVFILSAFTASFIASSALLLKSGTADVALSTSVLYLIPGVPLINSVIDILEGYTLTGVARLINTGLLITCTAIGLSLTLWIVKSSLI